MVKFGGNAMGDEDLAARFAEDIVLLQAVGIRPVVVHGGGPQIGDLMARLGKVPEFRNGLRVTDAETLDIARMVLVGKVNRDIVSSINVHGPLAVGLSGEDAGLITANERNPELGYVGDIAAVNPAIVERLLAENLIPVVSTIGADLAGQAYNINADTVAGALAAALGAEKVIYLTDVAGLLRDVGRSRQPHQSHLRPRAQVIDRRRVPHRRHDPQDHRLPRRPRRRGRLGPPARRARAPRGPARAVHRRRHRHHDHAIDRRWGMSAASTTHPPEPVVPSGLTACPFWPTYAPPRVQFVRGRGTELWDSAGRRYLDFLCGLAVTSLGHAHPDVAAAIGEQATTLLHTSNLFATVPGAEVAVTLDRLLGGGGQVFLCNSGAEANEAAIKVARRWGGRGRHVVVSAYGSFHGRTLATLHATGQPAKHEVFQPLPEGFRHAAWNDIDALAAAIDPTVAAVLLEPVQGEGGVNPADPGYLRDVRSLCDERGVLLMLDEVQTGLGRTGRWFGFEHAGIQPDVVTLAKALGNGVPIGACWARRDVAGTMEPGDHGTTFGGQPLAAAAARAVLAVMEREDAPGLARRSGARLSRGLAELDGVADGARSRPPAGRRAGTGARGQGGGRWCPGRRAGGQRGHAHRRPSGSAAVGG